MSFIYSLPYHLTSLLKVYREVFEYLIGDFKTYRPLLAAIKNEYEMMLNFHKRELKRFEPLKVGLKLCIRDEYYKKYSQGQANMPAIVQLATSVLKREPLCRDPIGYDRGGSND